MNEYSQITGTDKTLRALQMIELEGLKELDRICRKHNIKYSLGGGTCLGQLRHGGFIPWDDDIDVDMTLDNYEKFLEVAPLELDTNRFFLRCRETDSKWKRSFSRLEIKLTRISLKSWSKIGLKSGIFVDILVWNYLPNNAFLRKIVTSSLFYIRWLDMYKMYNTYTLLKPRYRTLASILKRVVPYEFLFFAENKLVRCCGNRKTNWIMDNAIVNGNHGGYLSEGMDEYTDVYFENIKVMNKKNPHNHMKTIYGDNYMEWLPPTDRISHHHWYLLNFGAYENYFDLPEEYEYYLTYKYNIEKIKQMQKVSFEMLDDIHKVCQKNGIKYYVSNINAYAKLKDADEYGDYFREPFVIAMPRQDYERFSQIAQKELGNKYFYQCSKTDETFLYPFARIRLNYTYIRETSIPKNIEDSYNNGFFITIIPLDNTSNKVKQRERHIKKIRHLNNFVILKWQNYNLRYFLKKKFSIKLKMILLLPISLKRLLKSLEKTQRKYDNANTNYYVDSTGYQLDYRYIEKDILGEGSILSYNGHSLIFPSQKDKYIEYMEYIENMSSMSTNKSDNHIYPKFTNEGQLKRRQEINDLSYVKKHFKESYDTMIDKKIKDELNKIQKKYGRCSLTYYDIPDYQSSVLRYDENEKRYLNNEEIIRGEENE